MALLPPSPSRDEWPSIRRGFAGCNVVMREICARHRLAASELAPAASGTRFSPVLLDGDIHPWHLLAARGAESWRLAGLIDFDDAMLGWNEYEFASPAVLMLAGDAASVETCLRAYGFNERDLNPGLRRRLMVYALLNRYWGLDVMLG